MVYEKPVRPTMLKAMRLTGVREAYFVINDYWYQSDQIIQQAKQTADEWYSIDDDKIHVFFFDARGDSVKFQNTAE